MNKDEQNIINFKNELSAMNNERLCDIIVSSRYLGSMKDEALMAMEELAKRRGKGDEFKFEEYIEVELKKLPSFNLDLSKILKIKGLGFFK
jgi:hypothetical protein